MVRRPDVENNIFLIYIYNTYICIQVFAAQVSEIEFRLFPNPVFDYVCRDNPLTRIRMEIKGNEFAVAPLACCTLYRNITYRNIKEVIRPIITVYVIQDDRHFVLQRFI